ncbi:hypothetical protein ACFCVO_10500 [Agromyces sp. NPDC056379]|uniref:hypothetical protein n=1 Tax=unclassified Agromyces TaxID=2639701 RepID=UPI0035DADF51
MSGTFWVGIAVVIVVALVTVSAIVYVRVSGKRLGTDREGADARDEAERLKDQGRRDSGWTV